LVDVRHARAGGEGGHDAEGHVREVQCSACSAVSIAQSSNVWAVATAG
jgi:hypothetical protein